MKYSLLLFQLVLSLRVLPSKPHGYIISPRSRNIVGYEDGLDWGGTSSTPMKDYDPHSLNKGGICGSNEQLNYNSPLNALAGPMPHNPQGTYTEGQEISTVVVLTAHHKGHHMFKACAVSHQGEIPTQACFDANPLEFVRDELYGAPKHEQYPDRGYIAPATIANRVDGYAPSGMVVRHVFKLPMGLKGNNVLLQWSWVTGNTCHDIGYDTYNWPDGWYNNAPDCTQPLPMDLPEQFWNCAEIVVTSATPTTTTPAPTSAPITTGTPVSIPTTPPASCPAMTAHCGPGSPCSDGTCCSQWGYCGTSAAHCNTCCQSNCSDDEPTVPTTNAPTPATPPTTSPASAVASSDNRVIAYMGNWMPCPTDEQVAHYTDIIVAFAVSYTWNPDKNICDTQCTIGSPVPVCNNEVKQDLVDKWRAAGKKVILSFGGAGMGGSWAGDVNDCWDYCLGKQDSVVSQLNTIVRTQNFDGVDIDYEYFYEQDSQLEFLKDVTLGLRDALPPGSIVTHAPMDPDLMESTGYYQVIKETASALDFIMPQYYNGFTRPVLDGIDGIGQGSVSALAHYQNLVEDVFDGDPTKVVFGFCISDCGGTNSNANSDQAAVVLENLAKEYECNGGAFFWVVHHDFNGNWAGPINTLLGGMRGCSDGSKSPTATPIPSTITAPPTTQPTSSTPMCLDLELPGNWGAGGVYDCDFYEQHGGDAYCAHQVLDEACCFCGGGDSSS